MSLAMRRRSDEASSASAFTMIASMPRIKAAAAFLRSAESIKKQFCVPEFDCPISPPGTNAVSFSRTALVASCQG